MGGGKDLEGRQKKHRIRGTVDMRRVMAIDGSRMS